MFQPRARSVMIAGCQKRRACWTPTDSPGFVQGPRSRGYSEIRRLGYSTGAPSKKTVCGECGTSHRSFYDRKVRRIRDLSCGEMRIYLEVEIRRVRCRRCGTVKQEKFPWLANNPFYTPAVCLVCGAAMQGDRTVKAGSEGSSNWTGRR